MAGQIQGWRSACRDPTMWGMTQLAAAPATPHTTATRLVHDIAAAHRYEMELGFQYATVWRTARASDPVPVLGPPAGEGWELNPDYVDGGVYVQVPGWSTGEIVHQVTKWRRRVHPDCQLGWRRQSIHVRVHYDGDPRPL